MAIIVTALMQAKDGKESELEIFLKAMIPHVQAEEGTLTYSLHRETEQKGRFLFYERYTDQAAFDLHKSTPYFQQLFKDIPDLLKTSPIIEIYEEIAAISRFSQQ